MTPIWNHPLLAQIGRFGLVGFVASGVHVAVAFCAHYGFEMSPLIANFLAFLFAWGVAYSGHFVWTFEGGGSHRDSVWRFTVVSLLSMALNQFIVWVVTSKLNGPFAIAIFLVVMIIPGLSFVISKFWTFRKPVTRMKSEHTAESVG